MVQNQLNQPGIEKQPSLRIASTKPRMRMGSQPIKPLKLPAFSRLNPANHPVQADQADQADASTVQTVEQTIESAIGEFHPLLGVAARSLAPLPQPGKLKSVQKKVRSATQTSTPPLPSRVLPLLNLRRHLSLPRLKKETWQWLILWAAILTSFGGTMGLAFLWLASPPPSVDCKKVSLSSLGTQRLYCAQELVRSGELSDLAAAMALLENWSADQPLYDEAQQAVTDWSKAILVIAHSKIAQNDMQGAIAAAGQIPPSSSIYLQAQEEIKTWRQEWQTGEGIVATAQTAIRGQDWKLASEQVVEMGRLHHEYWRINQADVLFKQIVREKQARQNLTQAQKLAKNKTPDNLAAAITLLTQIPANTHTSAEAQTAVQQWSQELIQVALQQWGEGDRSGAFATALKIPLNPDLPAAGLDLIRLSQANQLVASDLSELESSSPDVKLSQLWHLTEAVAAVQKIGSDSPFYEEAQLVKQTWQTHLQALTQLKFADWIAHSGDRSALEFAVAQASQISPASPRRVQAQSFIARWQQDIQALEDQPYLSRAQRWATSGQIPDLRTAIAQVRQIPDNRAAWHKAQELIAQWTAEIQTVEDQPIWEQAQKLAKQGKLGQAIDIAAQIPDDRALYATAQAAIEAWKAKIQATEIAEDQPILDRAYALAASERLTMAIDAAAQIAPGRALHTEAQAAIKAWDNQRQDIWNAGGPTTTAESPAAPDPSASTESPSPEPTPDATTPPTADSTPSDTANSSGFEGYYDEEYRSQE